MQGPAKMYRLFSLTRLYRLVSRGVIFFFILSLLLLYLYLLGNFQEFLDSSQIFLLGLLEISLLLEAFLGLFYIILIFLMRHRKIGQHRHLLVKLILSFVSVIFCYTLLLFFKFLSSWFQL